MGCCAFSHKDLIVACSVGTLDEIGRALDCGLDANSQVHEQIVSACPCCVGANVSVCRCFIHWWKNDGQSFYFGCTPLCTALYANRDLDIIKYLVSRGARVDELGRGFKYNFCVEYPIMIACQKKDMSLDTLKYLLSLDCARGTVERRPNPSSMFMQHHETAFRNALYAKNVPIIYYLMDELQIDLNNDFIADGKCQSSEGMSYLMCAVNAGNDVETISELLNRGSNINYISPNTGNNIFHIVESLSILVLLLNWARKVGETRLKEMLNVPNHKGETPFIKLSLLAKVKMAEVTKMGILLAQAGVNIYVVDKVRMPSAALIIL